MISINMKKILFAACLVMLAACTNKIENNDGQVVDDSFLNGLDKIYDFSDIDTENTHYAEVTDNGGLPNKYKYIQGSKKMNDSFFFVAIIFDEQTKKPIYQFTDYDRPITYIAYGEELYYYFVDNGIALLPDRLVLLMNYQGANIKTRTDYIQVYQDGSYKRTTIEDASEFQLRNWNSDHILFYIPYVLKPSYIYNTSTSKVIYKGIFACTRNIEDMSFHPIPTVYIISESDPLRFCTYHGDYMRNYQIVDISPNHELYELQKQVILLTEVEDPIPFDKMFDNFVSDGDYPDRIEIGEYEQIDYYSISLEFTRTTFSGQKDTCQVIVSIDKDGKPVFDIQGKQ